MKGLDVIMTAKKSADEIAGRASARRRGTPGPALRTPATSAELQHGSTAAALGPDTTISGAVTGGLLSVAAVPQIITPDPVTLPGLTPVAAAAIRAVLTALLVGVAAGLAAWATTDSVKQILMPALTAAVGILVSRFAIEGAIDSSRANLAAAKAARQ